MQHRPFSRTGWQVNPIGFGAWAIGADWGAVSDRDAEAALNTALDKGVNFIDTADVYGMGRSEKLIAKVLKSRGGKKDTVVATKAGRKLNPHVAEGYTTAAITGFVEQSLIRARLAIFERYLLPSEMTHMRENYGLQMHEWPPLIGELRDAMKAGVPPGEPRVQQLARRWADLFRAYAGDDPATHARIREAYANEPDLRSGSAVDVALLAYLQQAAQ